MYSVHIQHIVRQGWLDAKPLDSERRIRLPNSHVGDSEAEKRFGEEASGRVRILYGGSVKPDNIQGLMEEPGIDGALVGGASLDPVSFAKIVTAA